MAMWELDPAFAQWLWPDKGPASRLAIYVDVDFLESVDPLTEVTTPLAPTSEQLRSMMMADKARLPFWYREGFAFVTYADSGEHAKRVSLGPLEFYAALI
jgi:hypothetical protein